MATEPTQAPERAVTFVGATAIGIGGMVGGGIFAVLGVAAETAQGATPIAFAIAGIVAALTAYSYSKLSVHHGSAGGTVTFIDRAFGINDLTGTLNVVLWAGYITTTALYATAFANYGATLLPFGDSPPQVVLEILTAIAIVLPWLLNMTSAGLVAKGEGHVVIIKLLILVFVIIAGMPSVEPERLGTSNWPSLVTIISAGMLVFVAYEGFELIANASEDVIDHRRTLPRAFLTCITVVIVLYIAISIVVVGSLSPQQIVESADFALAEAAATSLGHTGFVLVGISAVLATLSAINATLYGSARLSYTIAREGELPPRAASYVWNQPIGLYITAGGALVIAIALPIESISGLASAIFLLVFATVNAAAYRTGRTAGVSRPLALLGVIGCLTSLVVLLATSLQSDLDSVVAFAIVMAVAFVVEHLYLKRRRAGKMVV